MARTAAALSAIISTIVGLLVIREVFVLLDPWSQETWYLPVLDAMVLLISFFLVSWLVYFLLVDVLLWLLQKIRCQFRGK